MSDTSARARRGRASIALFAVTLLPLAARPPVNPARDGITIVTGRITDPGGLPLASAMVSVDDRSRSATTGADGRYSLELSRTKAGEQVTLRARRVGYSSTSFVTRSYPSARRGTSPPISSHSPSGPPHSPGIARSGKCASVEASATLSS